MRNRITLFFASRPGIILAGAVIGIIAVLLQKAGNPPNMGVCVACFERDIAGALGLHRAAAVQYIRPEIIGFMLGSLVAALLFREFKARGGSAPIVRFTLGILAMIGALAFLGCPWRALLRLAGGDLNAIVGLAGLSAGIFIGVLFLKNGYTLGRSSKTYASVGWIMPLIMVLLFLLLVFRPKFGEVGALFFSEKGPGSMHAPVVLSLLGGLLIGFLAQRTRFCTMGSLRDIMLMKDFHLASGVAALLISAAIVNFTLGAVRFGFSPQPIAHSAHVWNFLGMALAGLSFTLAGGCPGRQLFLAGEGDGDAAIFALGMIVGAGISHNLNLAGKPDGIIEGVATTGGLSAEGMVAVVAGLAVCIAIGFSMREKW
ncbi:MAG: YedE-related selenium metabolism membrane protein [Chitinispirillaceae bacterium]|nr:YedE-related selenium metabolism membrane protein [Chitinispirillaceae bacterium]